MPEAPERSSGDDQGQGGTGDMAVLSGVRDSQRKYSSPGTLIVDYIRGLRLRTTTPSSRVFRSARPFRRGDRAAGQGRVEASSVAGRRLGMTLTLTDFLLSRIAEDEAVAPARAGVGLQTASLPSARLNGGSSPSFLDSFKCGRTALTAS